MRLAITLIGFVNLIVALPTLGQGESAAPGLEISKRIFIPADECQQNYEALESAANACYSLANAAAKDARGGSGSRMKKFFKADDARTRETVATGFDRIAQECISNSGQSGFRCVDLTGQCVGQIYGYQTGTAIVVCDPFYGWPLNSRECNANTQAVNLIHEISHLGFTVASSDYNSCYGLDCAVSLPGYQNLKHADTYRLYAQGKLLATVPSRCKS